MRLVEVRNELSVRGKNGIGFLCSAIVIWLIILILFLQSTNIYEKNKYMLFSTGLMFPLSVWISTFINADWKLKNNNPLGNLGLYLNLAQLIYFPILIWGMIKSPEVAIVFFAIITGAHFFPYGWFYNAKAYYVMAPIISVVIMFLGLYLNEKNLWLVPFFMVIFLVVLILWLRLDYKRKI